MRVLFCHDGPLRKDEFNNYFGTAHNDGTFSRYYNIAEELGVVIRVKEITNAEAELKLSKITVSPFKVTESLNTLSIKGMIFNKKKVRKVIFNEIQQSDYVVARLPSVNGFIAIDIAKELNKPYLVEVVTCPWDAFWNHSLKGKIVAPYMYYSTKKRINSAPYVLYVTNKFLQERYPTKGRSIGCSDVELKEFNHTIIEKRLEKIRSMNDHTKLVIGTAAAVNVKFKGQQYVIEAIGKLKRKGIFNIEYQLVGGGDSTYLRSIAEKYDVTNQVKFLGSIPHGEVFNWLDNIDLYVQPSRQEGLPRALVEAMSRGLPAFGAKTAGIPELLDSSCIFSNTKRNIDEICEVVSSFNKEKMEAQSIRNYNESQKYEKAKIDDRRLNFFKCFKENGMKIN